MEVIKKM